MTKLVMVFHVEQRSVLAGEQKQKRFLCQGLSRLPIRKAG